MKQALDLTGQVFGRLTVLNLNRIETTKSKSIVRLWNCVCICGKVKIVRGPHLKNHSIKSCGCLRDETTIKRSTKHGHSSSTNTSSEYMTWAQIIQRCTNSDHPRYKDYGGRGITVCDEWLDFKNFIKDVGLRPSPQHSLDRTNNEQGYNKNNFRWATKEEQGNNTRSNTWILWEGQRRTMAQWERYWNIPHNEFRSLLVKNKIIEP